MLELDGIRASYGKAEALRGVSLVAGAGEILCVLGRNGAGKTTIMKAIMGLLPLSSGRILLEGKRIDSLPAHEVARNRVGYVPQGRRLFPELSVGENLEMGLLASNSGPEARESALEAFPPLRERIDQQAGTLSGGEQQMLAVARALCVRPRVLLLDEPTEGLQPSMVESIRRVIVGMRREGIAVILVEQRVDAVLSIADQVAFIERGANLETLPAAELRADHGKIHEYLGV